MDFPISAAIEHVNDETPPADEAVATPPLESKLRKREKFEDKLSRVQASSSVGGKAGWHLSSMMVKSNDDLRQEVFIMQMITYFGKIFPAELTWLRTYEIQATGPDTGLMETINSAQAPRPQLEPRAPAPLSAGRAVDAPPHTHTLTPLPHSPRLATRAAGHRPPEEDPRVRLASAALHRALR